MKMEEHRPQVLVVEDDALVRLDLASALRDAGFDAVEASNADDALAVLSAASEVEILITDVQLFGTVDGVKLCWMVRDRWPPIHIFVVSGYHRAEEMNLPERSQFFAKPYRTERLISAVRESLS